MLAKWVAWQLEWQLRAMETEQFFSHARDVFRFSFCSKKELFAFLFTWDTNDFLPSELQLRGTFLTYSKNFILLQKPDVTAGKKMSSHYDLGNAFPVLRNVRDTDVNVNINTWRSAVTNQVCTVLVLAKFSQDKSCIWNKLPLCKLVSILPLSAKEIVESHGNLKSWMPLKGSDWYSNSLLVTSFASFTLVVRWFSQLIFFRWREIREFSR